jgi:hypothetical protein
VLDKWCESTHPSCSVFLEANIANLCRPSLLRPVSASFALSYFFLLSIIFLQLS